MYLFSTPFSLFLLILSLIISYTVHFLLLLSILSPIHSALTTTIHFLTHHPLSLSFHPFTHSINISFKDISTTVRLSDLLRLMLCSTEAMVLYDTHDRIIHTNKAYTRMTGYSLSDVEGKNNYTMLQGPLTDILAVQRCAVMCCKQEEVTSVTVTNYRKGTLMTSLLMCLSMVFIRLLYLKPPSISQTSIISSFFYYSLNRHHPYFLPINIFFNS